MRRKFYVLFELIFILKMIEKENLSITIFFINILRYYLISDNNLTLNTGKDVLLSCYGDTC